MQVGKKGMGSHKHGVSGTSGRSPRFKFMQKLEANRAEPKKKPKLAYGSIADALKNEKPK